MSTHLIMRDLYNNKNWKSVDSWQIFETTRDFKTTLDGQWDQNKTGQKSGRSTPSSTTMKTCFSSCHYFKILMSFHTHILVVGHVTATSLSSRKDNFIKSTQHNNRMPSCLSSLFFAHKSSTNTSSKWSNKLQCHHHSAPNMFSGHIKVNEFSTSVVIALSCINYFKHPVLIGPNYRPPTRGKY